MYAFSFYILSIMKTQKTFSREAPTNMPKSLQSQFMSMLMFEVQIYMIFTFISSKKLLQVFIWGQAVVFSMPNGQG